LKINFFAKNDFLPGLVSIKREYLQKHAHNRVLKVARKKSPSELNSNGDLC
jgi:hypothetical protein